MSSPIFRIVLVEDNDADVYLLRQALKEAGLDVDLTVITDGGDAMAFAKGQGKYANFDQPDLAVLDLNLPKNAGIEVLTGTPLECTSSRGAGGGNEFVRRTQGAGTSAGIRRGALHYQAAQP